MMKNTILLMFAVFALLFAGCAQAGAGEKNKTAADGNDAEKVVSDAGISAGDAENPVENANGPDLDATADEFPLPA